MNDWSRVRVRGVQSQVSQARGASRPCELVSIHSSQEHASVSLLNFKAIIIVLICTSALLGCCGQLAASRSLLVSACLTDGAQEVVLPYTLLKRLDHLFPRLREEGAITEPKIVVIVRYQVDQSLPTREGVQKMHKLYGGNAASYVNSRVAMFLSVLLSSR